MAMSDAVEALKGGLHRTIVVIRSLIGEDPVERAIMLPSLVGLTSFIVSIVIWLMNERPYNKYVAGGLLIAFLIAAGGLSIRLRMLEDRQKAREMGETTFQEIGLPKEEVVEYFMARAKVSAIKSWLGIIVLSVMLGIVAMLWPI